MTPGAPAAGNLSIDPIGDAYRRYQASHPQESAITRISFTTSDVLADYAAACDAATGIHVPAFNCNSGFEVPEGLSQTGLADSLIGTQIAGSGRGAPQIVGVGYQVETITSGGGDIWDAADNFLFSRTATTMTGDGTAEVLVNSLTNPQAFAKAGLMFRSALTANSAHLMMALTPTSGVMFQNRQTAGASATNTVVAGPAAPICLPGPSLRRLEGYQQRPGYLLVQLRWQQLGWPAKHRRRGQQRRAVAGRLPGPSLRRLEGHQQRPGYLLVQL